LREKKNGNYLIFIGIRRIFGLPNLVSRSPVTFMKKLQKCKYLVTLSSWKSFDRILLIDVKKKLSEKVKN
jgi:hypothetical protein